ncbi:subtilisin-like protease SBT5.3 [Elaeis guineensis]|uniref:Subtilisin-like protease SBT5.3 isoform X2 n=1 Tax=Elaeis guineensis var. tenera TaxID=51953 RepID=A0A6I9SG79_ELAGV|nr:subtilisin-like protease SBT5.3 isoform X2 [Elaeis guineensis]
MGIASSSSSLLLAFVFSLLLQSPSFAAKKSYVVYLGGHSHNGKELSLHVSKRVRDSHYELLASVLGNKEKAHDSLFYSYTSYINGFAANLEEEEAMEISRYPGVISVFPNRGYKLHTTRSWEFLGLERDGRVPKESLWTKARFGEDIIIGNLDTGVWPESESFKDDGLGPVPSKWKGICQIGVDKSFSCNRKVIGARYYNKGYAAAGGTLNATFETPRDNDGHGTHTLSTAGGGFVPGANIFGYGNGTAKGGSPRARVAAYKVCWPPINGSECFDADIIAAFDAAIHDGVDVLSVSLGGDPITYSLDGLAIGSFHAVKNGITVVCSAGNSGPLPGSVSNTAPWIITVGASTMDREFPAYINFNNKSIKGASLSQKGLPGNQLYPMINSKEAKAPNATEHDAELCYLGSLDPEKVRGKIVVCLRGIIARVEKGEAVLLAGGSGMVLVNDQSSGNEIIADAHLLPATHITYNDGLSLYLYLSYTRSPLGYITTPITLLDTKPAPFMAAFSSQGPNTVNAEILKPDITAPGVSVLAAYSEAVGPTGLPFDTRRVAFNSDSGTSMSCPHISGVVGLLKSLHPDWNPSAIKSAIMTTARTQDNMDEPVLNSSYVKATPFSYGSGHVRPNRAMDPGLVYDLTTNDYLNFLCSLGYNSTQIAKFSNDSFLCPSKPPRLEDLNYPSITIPYLFGSITVTRTLKNVGSPGTYIIRIREPRGISVSVNPTSLTYDKIGEEKKFEVTLKVKKGHASMDYVFGGLIWSDGKHYVRTPLVVSAAGLKP